MGDLQDSFCQWSLIRRARWLYVEARALSMPLTNLHFILSTLFIYFKYFFKKNHGGLQCIMIWKPFIVGVCVWVCVCVCVRMKYFPGPEQSFIYLFIYAFFIQGSTIQWKHCFPRTRWPWYTKCYNLKNKFMQTTTIWVKSCIHSI